jgi:hypothetical protein
MLDLEHLKLEISEVLENEGFETLDELLEEYGTASLVPCMCSCGAYVEPDGYCVGGNPSFLLSIGLI